MKLEISYEISYEISFLILYIIYDIEFHILYEISYIFSENGEISFLEHKNAFCSKKADLGLFFDPI